MSEFISSGDPLIDDLRRWAGEHAANSGGRLELLDYNPEVYPGQDGFHVEGEPQAHGLVDSIAIEAQPRYKELIARLQEQEESTHIVSMVGELLKGKNSVVLTTNHSDLIDIAVTHAAFYSQLDRLGYKPRTGIIISKMVAFLAYRLNPDVDAVPAVNVLKMLESETFLSYPRTESAKKKGIGRLKVDEIDLHNLQMRHRVKNQLGKGAMLLAVAPSGTTDKPIDENNPDTLNMARMGHGTYKLLDGKNTYKLPVAVWYEDDIVFDVCDIPRAIQSEDEAHNSMSLIAKRLTNQVSSKKFIYNS